MAMTITLKPALFRGDWDQARSQYSLLWFLEAMCRVNQSHIRQFRNLAEKGLKQPYPRLYKSGVHYERERGTEEWLDIPNILAGGSYPGVYPGAWDDCLPLNTLLLRDDFTMVPIGQIKSGMRIMGDGQWTTVTGRAFKGPKTILNFSLSNGTVFECSPEHRVFRQGRLQKTEEEIRAEAVREGTSLRGRQLNLEKIQRAILDHETAQSYLGLQSHDFQLEENHSEMSVTKIAENPYKKMCADIETDTGRFWLPETNLIVHNCEGLACWRVAELRELPWHWRTSKRDPKTGQPYTCYLDPSFRPPPGAMKVQGGMPAKPFAKFKKRDDGSFAYHALTLLPDGRLEDPSLTLGMTWEQEFHDRDIARKYQSGELPVQIRYADAPDTIVVDPESPTGFSSKIERAKRRTGLAGPEEEIHTIGDITNESPDEMIASWGVIPEAPDSDPELDAILGGQGFLNHPAIRNRRRRIRRP